MRAGDEIATTIAIAIAALMLPLGSVACGPSAEALEAQRVLHSIDALRDAPSEPLSGREPLLQDLERQEAKGAGAVRARDACAKAYRLLIEGKTLQVQVEKQLSSTGAAGTAGTQGAAGLETLRALVAAEAKIKESSVAMPECDTAASELRLKARGR